MTVLEGTPDTAEILSFVDMAVRSLQDGGLEPRTLIAGPEAYDRLCTAMAARLGRSKGTFEQYQWLTIVVDPFREDRLCVVPVPREVAEGVRTERV